MACQYISVSKEDSVLAYRKKNGHSLVFYFFINFLVKCSTLRNNLNFIVSFFLLFNFVLLFSISSILFNKIKLTVNITLNVKLPLWWPPALVVINLFNLILTPVKI